MNNWKDYNWDDVRPDPIPEVPGFVAQISYTEKFKETMQLFRTISASKEVSERAIALTTAIIQSNPAHYSVWDYRFDLVKRIGNSVFDYKLVGLTPSAVTPPPIGENGEWLNQFTLDNAKNYQIWNYRQLLIDRENPLWYANEHVLVKMVLEDDSKNFHAWSHFKWVVEQAKLSKCNAFQDGKPLLKHTEQLLDLDVYNNSVWSFRYFLLATFPSLLNPETELEFIFVNINKALENESSWVYLEGVISTIFPQILDRALKMAASLHSIKALEFLAEHSGEQKQVDLYTELIKQNPAKRGYYEYRIGC